MSVAGKELLVDAHLKLCPGERYGFIGRNGSGKSSLLRAMEAKRIAGFPEQSSTLVTHLASWGFVVAAPEHVERSLSGLLGTAGQGVAKSSDPDVLARTADLLTAAAATLFSPANAAAIHAARSRAPRLLAGELGLRH